MFTIINGYPSSGKSERIFGEISNSLSLGRQVILITPEQQLLTAEREIADRISPKDSLMVEVLSFRRLANRIFREYGGLCYNYLKPGGEVIIMWKAIMSVSPFLSLYKNVNPGDISTLNMFLSLEKAFSRSGCPLSLLDEIADSEDIKDSRLVSKLKDLSLIFASYRGFLGEKYTDPEDDVASLAAHPKCSEYFNGKDVYIDSFNSLTGSEYKVTEGIMRGCNNLFVTVNCLPDDKRDCNSKPAGFRKNLKKMAFKRDIEVNEVIAERKDRLDDPLGVMQRNIFSDNKEKYTKKVDNIRLICAPDPMAELEAAFEDILDYVKNRGGRYKDCVICSANIDLYSGMIKGLSHALKVPCFTSKRYSLSGRAAVRAVKLIPDLFRFSFNPDDVCQLIKTGFGGIEGEDGLLLEEYVRTWNIRGKKGYYDGWKMNPEGRAEEFSDEAANKLERINEIREKFIAPFADFERKLGKLDEVTVGDYLKCLTELLLNLDFPRKLNILADNARTSGDAVLERQHRHTWEQICKCFDAIYDGAGELGCSHENFSMLFDGVVGANDTGIIPTSNDEVLTGDALMIRPSSPKRVYILGVNDGIFPKNSGDGSNLFTDREIELLKRYELEMEGDSNQRFYDDLFSFYSVASVASEYLQVSYFNSDQGGKASIPSQIINEFTEIFENIEIEKTKPRTITRLLYIDSTLDEDWDEIMANTISDEVVSRLYGKQMMLSQSKIDRFVMCPFSYSCQYLLELKEEKSAEIKQDLFGTIIHLVLERFLKEADGIEGGVSAIDRDHAKKMVDEIIDGYAEASGCNDEDDIRIRHLLRRVKYTVLLLVCDLKEEFSKSKFRPRAFEVSVGFSTEGKEGKLYVDPVSIDLEGGGKALIRGYIDRLDSYKGEDGVYLRIVDYKTGEKSLTKSDVEKGLNIQMLLYMKCICSSESPDIDRVTDRKKGEKFIPAALLYHISKRPKVINGEAGNVKRSGFLLYDKEVLSAMDPEGKGRFIPYNEKTASRNKNIYKKEELEAMIDGVINTVKDIAGEMKKGKGDIAPLKTSSHDGCKYCKMYPICRRTVEMDVDGGDDE